MKVIRTVIGNRGVRMTKHRASTMMTITLRSQTILTNGDAGRKENGMLNNVFTGGYEYYIVMTGRGYAVKRIWEGSDSDPEIMHEGSYAGCAAYIRKVYAENYEYDNDL